MSGETLNQVIQAQMNTRATLADVVKDSGMASSHQVVLSTIVRMWMNPGEGGKIPPADGEFGRLAFEGLIKGSHELDRPGGCDGKSSPCPKAPAGP
ncbi:hypothetical protein AAFF_G00191770 [Aldrovandia affinis]|uniref:Uncharacterized protein n=1 Tax=Aldrovandia affinis TaxID=143900 RepID=A0AAD7RJI0_9TELE|nr:hypothetical protein AAFF_G00191770 [Aldrovandia affinis]